MTVWLITWIACLVMATEAVPCHHTHRCSDCDRKTGDCLTECDTGYYDRQCRSTCSRNCVNNTCVLSEHGSDDCTDGCVPGYSGIGCNIPCDSPGGNCTACPGGCDGGYCQLGSSCVSGCVDFYYGTGCNIPYDSPGGSCTACPGGCDGGYCQLGSSCVSGCVDSYYGTGCKNCSSGCTPCNRSTGTCDDKSGTTLGLSVGLSGAFLIKFLVLCCKYCQRLRQNSVTNKTEMCNNVAEIGGATVQELEWYTEIPLTDMTLASGSRSSGGNCGVGGEASDVAGDVYDVADGGQRGFAAVIDRYLKRS